MSFNEKMASFLDFWYRKQASLRLFANQFNSFLTFGSKSFVKRALESFIAFICTAPSSGK